MTNYLLVFCYNLRLFPYALVSITLALYIYQLSGEKNLF